MGIENIESSKAKEMRLGKTIVPEEENEKVATSMEGAHSNKLGFGVDARIDEGKGSNEKK